MKKFLLSIMMATALSACGEKAEISSTPKKTTIKIGVIAPLTGNMSLMGDNFKKGVELFKEQHPDRDITIIFEDDALNSTKTVLAVKKLIETDNVNAILTYSSQAASVTAPIVANSKAIHISQSTDTEFTKKDKNYAFTSIASEDAEILLQNIVRRGYKKIALITANETFSNLVETNIKEQISNYDLQIVFDEKIIPSTKDFRLLIQKSQLYKPDIYIVQSWSPEIDIFVRQLKEYDVGIIFTSMYSPFFSNQKELYENGVYLNNDPIDREFVKLFIDKYGHYPNLMASTAYVMTDIAEALARNEKTINDVIGNMNTIFGKINIKGRVISFKSVIRKIINGQPVVVEE